MALTSLILYLLHLFMQESVEGIICLCGNDGTGKSTLHQLFTQFYP